MRYVKIIEIAQQALLESQKSQEKETSEIYKKHFPEVYDWNGVGLMHQNMESFFEEINENVVEKAKLSVRL